MVAHPDTFKLKTNDWNRFHAVAQIVDNAVQSSSWFKRVNQTKLYDLAIVGGGINGTGIARDAAGRGLSVLLVEKGDLAGATSSASTKLIHGGLRYLEHREFRLVREALAEREVLLQAAPHIVRPLRFVLPHHKGLRPWWMVRAGLFLYDHMGGRRLLPPTRVVNLRHDPVGAPLKAEFSTGFEYSDCWVDDARLVVLNARDASLRGTEIRTHVACLQARPVDGLWSLSLSTAEEARARVLVNAAGPWVSNFLSTALGQNAPTQVRMVKGSHIVVRRLFGHEQCYIFQNRDGRVCFAIPYEDDFTLIGTTDEDYRGDPADAAISPAEEAYLLAAVGSYLRTPINPASIVWRYAGVRPLRDDGSETAQETTRDYVLELNGTPPVLSVFGGKITTFRRLAEAAMARLAPWFPNLSGSWTANASLPGGDFPWNDVRSLQQETLRQYPFLTQKTLERFVRSYGTLTREMLGDAGSLSDLGRTIGADLTEREVDWLIRTEWAQNADDILWRRSKLGLRFSATEKSLLHCIIKGV